MLTSLVVGGAGFIGSHVSEALLGQGCSVRVLDDLSTGKRENLEGLDVELLVGDAADETVASQACEGVDRIFHLGARPSVPWSLEHPELALRANFLTTKTLLDAATKKGVSKFVFSSSSAVYGDNPIIPKEESMSIEPQSPYAEHKAMGEDLLKGICSEKAIDAVCLRYFNVYGPRQDPSSPYSGVISLFAQWAKQGKAPIIFGDGLQTRDFVFVSDVVKANLLAAGLQTSEPAPVINIGTGQQTHLLELWKLTCRAACTEAGAPHFEEVRSGDIRHSVASIQKAKSELGFGPQVSLADGLRKTIAEI